MFAYKTWIKPKEPHDPTDYSELPLASEVIRADEEDIISEDTKETKVKYFTQIEKSCSFTYISQFFHFFVFCIFNLIGSTCMVFFGSVYF